MDIKKLQKELVEKIFLIPAEADSEAIGKEALEIINKLKDSINDTVIIDNKQHTILDYVIIADSKGTNPKLSKRPRINNKTLKELENVIRDIRGKTSEELGWVNDLECHNFRTIENVIRSVEEQRYLVEVQGRLLEEEQRYLSRRRRRETIAASFILLLCSFSLFDQLRRGDEEEFSMFSFGFTAIMTLITGAVVYGVWNNGRQLESNTNLENATVEAVTEERELTIDQLGL